MSIGTDRWFLWVRLWAVGMRLGTRYLHLRPDPLDVYSERYGIKCRYWQLGRWRLTYRWGCS